MKNVHENREMVAKRSMNDRNKWGHMLHDALKLDSVSKTDTEWSIRDVVLATIWSEEHNGPGYLSANYRKNKIHEGILGCSSLRLAIRMLGDWSQAIPCCQKATHKREKTGNGPKNSHAVTHSSDVLHYTNSKLSYYSYTHVDNHFRWRLTNSWRQSRPNMESHVTKTCNSQRTIKFTFKKGRQSSSGSKVFPQFNRLSGLVHSFLLYHTGLRDTDWEENYWFVKLNLQNHPKPKQ